MRNAFSEKLDRLSPGHVTANAMFRTDSTKSTLIPPDSLVLIFSGMTNLQPAAFEVDWLSGELRQPKIENCSARIDSSRTAILIRDYAA
jgi:hypothetical protein